MDFDVFAFGMIAGVLATFAALAPLTYYINKWKHESDARMLIQLLDEQANWQWCFQ